MEEKMRDKTFATAVVTMCGQVKQSVDDTGEAVLSSPVEGILQGAVPILIGHPESWSNQVGQNLLRRLQKNGQVIFHFIDELHQGLQSHWESIRFVNLQRMPRSICHCLVNLGLAIPCPSLAMMFHIKREIY